MLARIAAATLLCVFFPPAAVAGGYIHLLVFDTTVNPVSARYLSDGLARAAREGAEAVVIELDTPGGLSSAMDRIVQAMLASPVPLIVYVYPPGARAASAGVFLAMAAPLVAMAPGTNIGAAHPVGSGGSDIGGAEGQKILNDAAARIRSLAQLRGHNERWAEEAVRSSASLTGQDAVRQGVANLMAGSLEELLAAVDGRTVAAAGGTRTLATAGLPVRTDRMGLLDRLLDLLVDPNLAYILFLVGILGFLVELATPGVGLAGIAGGIAWVLAFIAFGILPTNLAGILVLLLAAALFVLDIKAPTHGVLTAAAIVALVLGSVLLFPPWRQPALPGFPRMRVSPVTIVVMTVLTSGLFLTMLTFGIRAQGRRVTTGPQALIGAPGTALTDLDPAGMVRVRWEEWNAFTSGEVIRAGEEIEVAGVDGLRLRVQRKVRRPPASR